MCKRNWGDVKEIKSGKRSGLSSESVEKRAIIFTTARVKEARLRMNTKKAENEETDEFKDQDFDFNKELEKVGVVMKELKRPVRKRVFNCWINDKES